MHYRVDNLPWPLRPLVTVYGLLSAALLLLLWAFLRVTVRVKYLGRPRDFASTPTLECLWHDALEPYFVAAMPFPKPHAWLNHPALYMKGVHYFLRVMGVRKLALGSSGHGGRDALVRLVPLLREGYSSFLNPDGPHGPAHELRPGILELAEQSGLPVIALHVRCSAAWRLPTWDRKLIPKPFSTVELVYSPPLHLTAENRAAVAERIRGFLDTGEVLDWTGE